MKIEYSNIFESIKQDNLNLFSTSIKNNENISFGRFPILSLCYLYNAKKILKSYINLSTIFYELSEYKIIDEPFEIYKKFKTVAGRTLRLYISGSVVSPAEMLAILHKDSLLKKEYAKFNKTPQQLQNLRTIFQINKQKASIDEEKLTLQKQKLTTFQFNFHKVAMLAVSIVTSVICLIFLTSGLVMGFGSKTSPFNIYNQTQLLMALNANKNYELKNNITLTGSIQNLSFSGNFNGNNYTIFVNGINQNFLIDTNSGTIENLNIVYIPSSNFNGEEEITKQITTSTSLLVNNNKGTLNDITISTPKLNLTYLNSSNDIFVNGFATTNSGDIKNCHINMNAQVNSTSQGEGYFSGFVGKNNGTIENCTYNNNSNVETAEVDVTGFASINNQNATIENCKNYANISHISQRETWSPNASGIALTNYGSIKNCYNYGSINVSSNCTSTNAEGAIFAGGICSMNYSQIGKCLNKGQITAFSKHIIVYAGGITAYSTIYVNNQTVFVPSIKNCGVDATISIATEDENVQENKFTLAISGGISGFLYGNVENCFSLAKFENANAENYEKKFFIASLVGATNMSGLNIYVSAKNNHCLLQDYISDRIGAVINGGSIAKYDETIEQLIKDYKEMFNIDIEEPYLSTILCYSNADEIKSQGVYWNE